MWIEAKSYQEKRMHSIIKYLGAWSAISVWMFKRWGGLYILYDRASSGDKRVCYALCLLIFPNCHWVGYVCCKYIYISISRVLLSGDRYYVSNSSLLLQRRRLWFYITRLWHTFSERTVDTCSENHTHFYSILHWPRADDDRNKAVCICELQFAHIPAGSHL